MKKTTKSPDEDLVKDIKRATRKRFSSEEKIRIVVDGLRSEGGKILSSLTCAPSFLQLCAVSLRLNPWR